MESCVNASDMEGREVQPRSSPSRDSTIAVQLTFDFADKREMRSQKIPDNTRLEC